MRVCSALPVYGAIFAQISVTLWPNAGAHTKLKLKHVPPPESAPPQKKKLYVYVLFLEIQLADAEREKIPTTWKTIWSKFTAKTNPPHPKDDADCGIPNSALLGFQSFAFANMSKFQCQCYDIHIPQSEDDTEPPSPILISLNQRGNRMIQPVRVNKLADNDLRWEVQFAGTLEAVFDQLQESRPLWGLVTCWPQSKSGRIFAAGGPYTRNYTLESTSSIPSKVVRLRRRWTETSPLQRLVWSSSTSWLDWSRFVFDFEAHTCWCKIILNIFGRLITWKQQGIQFWGPIFE